MDVGKAKREMLRMLWHLKNACTESEWQQISNEILLFINPGAYLDRIIVRGMERSESETTDLAEKLTNALRTCGVWQSMGIDGHDNLLIVNITETTECPGIRYRAISIDMARAWLSKLNQLAPGATPNDAIAALDKAGV